MVEFTEAFELRHEIIVDNEIIGYARNINDKCKYDIFVYNKESGLYGHLCDNPSKERSLDIIKSWYLDGGYKQFE